MLAARFPKPWRSFLVASLFGLANASIGAEEHWLTKKAFCSPSFSPAQKALPMKTFSIEPLLRSTYFPTKKSHLAVSAFSIDEKRQLTPAVPFAASQRISLKPFSDPFPKPPDALIEKMNTRLSIEDVRELLNRSR